MSTLHRATIRRMVTPTIASGTRVAVRLPNAMGDAVMATPLLAQLSAAVGGGLMLIGPPMALEVLEGGPWIGQKVALTKTLRRGLLAHRRLAGVIREAAPDVVFCLPNSIGSLLPFWLAGVPHRIGYAKEGRGFMLTASHQRLRGLDGRFLPTYTGAAFLRLGELADGLPKVSPYPQLFTTEAGRQEAEAWRRANGLVEGRRYFIVVPGAAFGLAKLWMPDRYAAVADRLTAETGAACYISAGPGEEAVAGAVRGAMKTEALPAAKLSLRGLKAVFAGAALVVGNDTGPRHLAVGFGVPAVTVMGPNDPRYTEIVDRGQDVHAPSVQAPLDAVVRVDVPCGPCQRKTCPLIERICMTGVTVDAVYRACASVMAAS